MEYFGKVLHELEIASVGDAISLLFMVVLGLALVGSLIWLLIFHTVATLIFASILGGFWLIDYFIKSSRRKYERARGGKK